MATVRLHDNLRLVQRLFKALRQMGGDPKPLMETIAAYGEASTRARFRSETGPDGQRWQPSLRAQLFGGRTLTKDGHLGDSITSQAKGRAAEWGTNRIYAAIHQFGGTIKGKNGPLRFVVPGIGWRSVPSVTLPARPFLGLDADDRQEILDITADYLANLVRQRAAGGA